MLLLMVACFFKEDVLYLIFAIFTFSYAFISRLFTLTKLIYG